MHVFYDGEIKAYLGSSIRTLSTYLKYFNIKLSTCRVFLLFDLFSSYTKNFRSQRTELVFSRSSAMDAPVSLQLKNPCTLGSQYSSRLDTETPLEWFAIWTNCTITSSDKETPSPVQIPRYLSIRILIALMWIQIPRPPFSDSLS